MRGVVEGLVAAPGDHGREWPLRHGEEFGHEDISSGGMAAIQENLARLPETDLRAIAEYLLSLE